MEQPETVKNREGKQLVKQLLGIHQIVKSCVVVRECDVGRLKDAESCK